MTSSGNAAVSEIRAAARCDSCILLKRQSGTHCVQETEDGAVQVVLWRRSC